jgi:subtilisin family serine protease
MNAIRSTLPATALLALAACADATPAGSIAVDAAPLHAAQTGRGVQGEYIVVLKDGADARAVAAQAGASPRFVYTSALNGFSAALNEGQLTALRHNPHVDYVEQDQVGGIAVTQSPVTWGLDRIDQRPNALNNAYTYNTTAGAVRAYVIDSGLQANHPQFGTRAQNVYDYTGGSGADCNGHGTHVAGTIASTTYGVAKAVLLRGVRVVDCNGYGTTSVVTAAIDWVRANHLKPAVANMSLSYPYSAAVNTASTNLVNAGVYTAVASGNANADACNYSPASATGTLSTNAVDRYGARATFSNWGACTDIYAPGVAVTSTWINGGTNTISGTSMASPHVAGVAALYKATYGDLTSSTITSWILNNASTGYVTGNPAGTPNRVLYKAAM